MTLLYAVLLAGLVINLELLIVVLISPRIAKWAMRKAMTSSKPKTHSTGNSVIVKDITYQ